ncbi:MAG: bifunctional DNA primase/polymerase [Anaerolineales bacterium]|nr:bifunctional DNA primase/polymerase [Anaerolineales bacterium]
MITTTAHTQYLDLGYSPIPLKPASKLPLVKGWQVKPTVRQWYGAPKDANIGLRAGDGRAFLDCDDKNQPGTFDNVVSWLAGLGYHPGSYPVVQTASGIGRHVYVNWAGRMLGSKRNFVNQFGAGDFRYDAGAQVAAPPSIVDSGAYTLIGGDLLHLPVLDLKDIAQVINVNEAVTDHTPPSMSGKAIALANGNADVIGKYKSRSEAEYALVLSMIDSGYDFTAIKRVFDTMPCGGKYAEMRAENSANAGRWLGGVYREAEKYSQNESPLRRQLAELQGLAERAPWQWASDKNILIAHIETAAKAGRVIYNASVRDLALFAGVDAGTASRANHRLTERKLLSVEHPSGGMLATQYALQLDKVQHTLSTSLVRVCCKLSTVQEAGTPTWKGERIATHDAFRNGKNRLGQRAGQVYELLLTHPDGMTEQELSEATGAHIKTIRRALDNLKVTDRKTGEVIELVTKNGDKWQGEIVDLDLIAAIFHTYAAREEQRERYEQERRDHRNSLEKGLVNQ